MNYKKLLESITRQGFSGGKVIYSKCMTNVILGADSINVHIEDGKKTLAEFDFTFEIPRRLVFHNMNNRTSDCIRRNLEAIYNCKIPVYQES